MSQELSFDNVVVPEDKPQTVYAKKLTAGRHKVKVTKVEKASNASAGTPCLDITVEDETGAVCTHRFQLNTVVGEGKTTSAWAITSLAILYLVQATNKVDEVGAKAKLAGMTMDNIDTKLSSLLIGKMFAISLKGEHIPNSDVTKDSWIKVEFSGWHFARPLDEFEKLSEKPYIKGIPVKGTHDANGGIATVKTDKTDLPW